ncbi:hypothetical protein [Pseudoalteromonas obscura]|uniref:Uncharacterized protein n=1 Tax=Pseudoalteromonas obscura TaxID=3048491 RepID=A0ABT7EDU4_9GAMM|nr:hypothetical protein [Pseudoalteromonas sp. P94(2023)]MDK2593453.1 hypothetical protein [Pseudoalteromonas sp. P94(2023)]
MKAIYILPLIFMSSSNAGTIPAIYECVGGYKLPNKKVEKGFCDKVLGFESEHEKVRFIEEIALRADLSNVSCGEEVEKFIYPILYRLMAESVEIESFNRLNKKSGGYVNYVVDYYGRNVTPAGVAALCGYDDNLEKLISIGGVPQAKIILEVHDISGRHTRSFSLSEAMDFNEPIKSRYETLNSEEHSTVYDNIVKSIARFRK